MAVFGSKDDKDYIAPKPLIEIGQLVEINRPDLKEHGVRMFVVKQTRNMSGGYDYALSYDKDMAKYKTSDDFVNANMPEDNKSSHIRQYLTGVYTGKVSCGWSLSSLIVIRAISS